MKKLSAVIILLLISSPIFAQYSASRLCNEHIKLNGGVRSQFGGISRTYIPLNIPPGTSHLAISITVSPTDNIDGYALTASLASALSGNITSIPGLLNSMQGQPGNGIIDMLLYNSSYCAGLFTSKSSELCRALYYRQNSGGGIFQYEVPYPGTYYLCFRNPSEIDAVYFHVEATAIIPDHTDNNSSAVPEYSKQEMKDLIEHYKNLKLKE